MSERLVEIEKLPLEASTLVLRHIHNLSTEDKKKIYKNQELKHETGLEPENTDPYISAL